MVCRRKFAWNSGSEHPSASRNRGPPIRSTLHREQRGAVVEIGSLSDQIALHFSEGGLNLQEGAPCRRGRVHRRVERLEGDALLFEVTFGCGKALLPRQRPNSEV